MRSVLTIAALVGTFGLFESGSSRSPQASAHPVHASSTQVELTQNHRRLDIAVRMFTDDLEAALAKGGHRVSIDKSDPWVVDSALSSYLGKRVLFGIDGGALRRARLVRHGLDPENATLVFLELDLTATPGRITIEQSVMLDQFDDQTNLVHIRFDTMKRSALLRRGSERADFEFR